MLYYAPAGKSAIDATCVPCSAQRTVKNKALMHHWWLHFYCWCEHLASEFTSGFAECRNDFGLNNCFSLDYGHAGCILHMKCNLHLSTSEAWLRWNNGLSEVWLIWDWFSITDPGARCSSVVRASAHGDDGSSDSILHRVRPIELFLKFQPVLLRLV